MEAGHRCKGVVVSTLNLLSLTNWSGGEYCKLVVDTIQKLEKNGEQGRRKWPKLEQK